MPHPRAPRPLPPPPVPGRDDSPENLQRIRDELMADFDAIHALLTAKEIAGAHRPDDPVS